MLVCLRINSPSKFDKLAVALVMLSLVLGCDEKKENVCERMPNLTR